MPIIATYYVEEIEVGQKVKLIKTDRSIHVEPDEKGDYEITGVFPDERQVFVSNCMDKQIEFTKWDDEATVHETDWQDSGPTRHDITEDGAYEERLEELDDAEVTFDEDHEVSGLHMLKAYSLVFLPDDTKVRLKLLNGSKLAMKDPCGEYIVTGSVKRIIGGADGYEVVVTTMSEHQRASERRIGERYATGRRSGVCGSNFDFVDQKTREEFLQRRKRQSEQKQNE